MTPAQYKALRRELGTQSDVAEMLGVSRPTITRREAAGGRITEEAAIAIRELVASREGQGAAPTPATSPEPSSGL